MDDLLESLRERMKTVQLTLQEVLEERETARSAYASYDQQFKLLEYKAKELSVAINALEKSAKAPESGASDGNGHASPFQRRRRNIREMVRSALEHADHPMTERELMEAVEATKISVNQALSHLVVHGQATPLEGGWILESKKAEYQDHDDDEEEGEETSGLHDNQVDEREHMYE